MADAVNDFLGLDRVRTGHGPGHGLIPAASTTRTAGRPGRRGRSGRTGRAGRHHAIADPAGAPPVAAREG